MFPLLENSPVRPRYVLGMRDDLVPIDIRCYPFVPVSAPERFHCFVVIFHPKASGTHISIQRGFGPDCFATRIHQAKLRKRDSTFGLASVDLPTNLDTHQQRDLIGKVPHISEVKSSCEKAA